jgi:hypothetical protein
MQTILHGLIVRVPVVCCQEDSLDSNPCRCIEALAHLVFVLLGSLQTKGGPSMFGLFKKKQPTMMDAFIGVMYGANPPAKSADLERSITIAHEDLLCERVSLSEVKQRAGELFRGPIPYSTHDLAVSTALAFFKNPEYVPALRECQLPARMRVFNWANEGKVVKLLAQNFEEVLYRRYKPQPPESLERFTSDSLPPEIRKPAEPSQSSSSQPQTDSPRSPWAGRRMDVNTFWENLRKFDKKCLRP